MRLVYSTEVSIEDHEDMKTHVVVALGATEIKDWDGTEKASNGKLVNNVEQFSVVFEQGCAIVWLHLLKTSIDSAYDNVEQFPVFYEYSCYS